jgi:hypothetical protein
VFLLSLHPLESQRWTGRIAQGFSGKRKFSILLPRQNPE